MTALTDTPLTQVGEDVVTLLLPARSSLAALPRTIATSLAARADLTLDEIDDLRIAVSEAFALLTDAAAPGASVECVFVVGEESVSLLASVVSLQESADDRDSFAWTVLAAVTDSLESSLTDGVLSISLTRRGSVHDEETA